MTPVANWKDKPWFAPAIVFSLALILFSINLDRPADPDELHHVLAAQQLLETGLPLIGDGEYRRGILHTWMVAISYEVFGYGLDSARFPAVLLVALAAAVLFVWVRHEAGLLAAWIAASLYVFSPFTVEIAQFSRFYALQIIFFLLGSMCFFYSHAAHVSVVRRVLLGGSAAVLLFLAISHQVTTYFGIAGIAGWTFGFIAHRIFLGPTTRPVAKRIFTVGVIAAVAVIVILIAQNDIFEWASIIIQCGQAERVLVLSRSLFSFLPNSLAPHRRV
jgi:4-amino-4-deoxy-L-arabinose transferase-like glycosyltransferase